MNSAETGEMTLQGGEEARRAGEPDAARKAFAEAAGIFLSLGLTARLAYAKTRQAQIERDCGNLEAALAFQREAIALQRPLGDPMTLAHMLRHAGDILRNWGRHADAEPYYAEALTLYRSIPDVPPLELANALRGVALHKNAMGTREEAIALGDIILPVPTHFS